MQRLLKIFGVSVIGLGMCGFIGMSYANQPASGRAAYNRVSGGTTTARMPSMPTLPIFTTGNTVTNTPSNNQPQVTPQPEKPQPEPEKPQPEPEKPQPEPECPDGGVKNSTYTVENCMNDVLRCVNSGALPGGLNDMFNEDLRNAIMNGMGICSVQVDKCVETVRKDCRNVYRANTDVWIDFNARRVQPEYYSFVLRKTGLTPNQAENTCRLLDKNTYGSAFTAVANSGNVTAEYNNKVGAYNQQMGNILVKNNPQGLQVNDGNPGVDGQRGHYARWDASAGECLIRVAAYNKDNHIKNSWLFGALGDDKPAEVWKAAGETFTCNKDLFGFSLMNKTSTAAVAGIGGGTLVGAGVGAIAGHGKRPFDCGNEKHREMLTEELRVAANIGILGEYMVAGNRISSTGGIINEAQCNDIVELYDAYRQIQTAIDDCDGVSTRIEEELVGVIVCDGKFAKIDDCFADLVAQGWTQAEQCIGKGFTTPQQCLDLIANNMLGGQGASSRPECNSFKPINLAKIDGTSVYCPIGNPGCLSRQDTLRELTRLDSVFTREVTDMIEKGEKSNMGKSIAVGAAVGAGAGALGTAITAFVERNNINCRVGDGLEQVGFGKSHAIGTLRDFYVKWNLQVPDTVQPTAVVNDCASWRSACAQYKTDIDCKNAQINYKPAGAKTTELIRSACAVSGSACVENYPVAKSYGACE